jgi:hypothetical protein
MSNGSETSRTEPGVAIDGESVQKRYPTYPGRYGGWETAFKLYEDGKYRRYELLFAVNGAAFSVAKLFPEAWAGKFLKNLSLEQLAFGMIVFTISMMVDIYVFGERMREDADQDRGDTRKGMFSIYGKAVLIVLCATIVAGWGQVAGLWSTLLGSPGAA